MAKNPKDQATENHEQTAAPATNEAPAADERFKMVTDPETNQPVKRKDYILKCWQQKKMSRGAIAKHLTELTGKKVTYQIIFATVKKHPGGPDKPAEGAAPAAAA